MYCVRLSTVMCFRGRKGASLEHVLGVAVPGWVLPPGVLVYPVPDFHPESYGVPRVVLRGLDVQGVIKVEQICE